MLKNLSVNRRKGYTLKEVLPVMGCVGVAAVGLIAAVYMGLGTLGWNAVKKYVDYEDKFYQALSKADKNKDGDLDIGEFKDMTDKMGTVLYSNQRNWEIKPSYDSLVKYLKSN